MNHRRRQTEAQVANPEITLGYELKPYLCIAAGSFLLNPSFNTTTLGKVSSITLILCGVIILLMRFRSRGNRD